jgi:hypothetical protein
MECKKMHGINNVKFTWHVLSITSVCIGIHGRARRLSSFTLLCNVFGIIGMVTIVDSNSGVI